MNVEKNETDSLSLYGNDLFGNPVEPPSRGKIADEFLIPPFSVLNAREGWWQERKESWTSYGIQGETGREEGLLGSRMGYALMEKNEGRIRKQQGTSIFDPVLCELVYRWFCPRGGQVVDPFAGGSVRGIVAHMIGRRYWGCDLRAEQVEANREQGNAITPESPPSWVCADAIDAVPDAPMADLIFSCPPYGDLERYSDNPRDLSTMEYHTFSAALKRIVLRCVERLKPDRFACFVVGEFRDKRGFYRNFVGDTVRAFEDAGARYYNEAILVTNVGSLPIRINRQFKAAKKMGKTHQNVLVFVKGDPRKATEYIDREERT